MLPVLSQDTARVVNTGFWTSPQTWENGNIPVSSDDLVILIEDNKMLNINTQDITCDQILIRNGSQLNAVLGQDINLQVRYIEIKGQNSKMHWGTATSQYTGNTCITLTGNEDDEDIVACNSNSIHKGIMVMNGGLLQLYGNDHKASWSQLGSTANVGDNSIIVDGDVQWESNDEIVIASTDFDMCHAEVRVVDTCYPINGNTQSVVTFSNPLTFSHYGELQNFTNGEQSWVLDERAEVGLLTKNIKIQGDASSQDTRFGGHIMIMPGMPDPNTDCQMNGLSSTAKVSNVEFYRMGQENRLGRYPIHWHLNGDSNTSFIKNSSVHNSYNRAITVHGTQNVTVTNNVAYDVVGHAYFLENGTETGVIIEDNLGLVTRRPSDASLALLESDYFPYYTNSEEARNSNKFTGPATFWISNPDNTVRNNHAAGSDGSGFWLAPHFGLGTSGFPSPSDISVPEWIGNVAHSNYHGILLGGQPTNGSDIINDGNGLKTLDPVRLYDHTMFKNIQAAYIRCDKAQTFYYNWKIADNIEGMVGTYESYYDGCLYVGHSDNYEIIECDKVEGERIWDGLVEKRRRVWGHTLYDGPSFINNSHFANFNLPYMSPISNWGAANRSFVSEFNGTTIDSPNPQIHLHQMPYRDTHFIGAGIYDDGLGTFTGIPNGAIVMNDPMMVNENCHSLNEELNCRVCEHRYGHISISDYQIRQPMILYRSEKNVIGPKINVGQDIGLGYHQYNPIINEKYIYRVLWSDYIPDSILIRASSFKNSESTIIEFLNVPSTVSHEIQRSISVNNICVPENNLEALFSANRTCFYKENNSLFVKIYLTSDYHDDLNGGQLDSQEEFKVYFHNSMNSQVTLCDLSIWDDTNNASPFIKFDEQDWSNFDYIKVTGNFNQPSLEFQIYDNQSEDYVSVGNVLNNNDLYFTLPKEQSKRDRISGVKLISDTPVNLTGLKIELLNKKDISESNLPPNLTTSVLYHSPTQNDVINLYDLFIDDNLGGNITFTVDNLPDNFSHIGGQIHDFTVGAGTYTLTVSADDGEGGINKQEIIIDANYIHNASFEYPDQENSDGFIKNNFTDKQENTSWVFPQKAGYGIAQKPSSFLVNIQSPSKGKQAGVIQNASTSEMCNSIYVPANIVGLSFQAAQRGCNNQRFTLKIDGTIIDTIIPPSNYFTKYFVESDLFTEGPHTICFNGLGVLPAVYEYEPCLDINEDHTAFIDNLVLMEESCQDIDSDMDGVCDTYDQCPGQDDNFSEDIDQDGIPDVCDNNIITNTLVLTYECDMTSIDSDNDNIPDDCDSCTRPDNFEENGFEIDLGNSIFQKVDNTCSYTDLVYLIESVWYFGQGTGVSSDTSPFAEFNPNAPEGNQVALIQGNGGEICQVIQTHNDSETHYLEFMAAQRLYNGDYPNTPFSLQELAIIVDGDSITSIQPTNITYDLYGTLLFFPNAGCHEICFKGLAPLGTDNTVFIDEVNLEQECTDEDADGICDIYDDCTESFTILDGSFEIALDSDYNIYPAPILNLSNWTFGQNTGVSSNNSAYTSENSDAPEGNQVAFIQGDVGEICQTIQTANNGEIYALEFEAAQRLYNGNFPTTPFSMQEIAIIVDGEMVTTVIPTDTTYALYGTLINLDAGCHTICFKGLTEIGEDNTVFIDAVNLLPSCTDNDTDGICDFEDTCIAGQDADDIDGDGIPDICDDCVEGSEADDIDGDNICDNIDDCFESFTILDSSFEIALNSAYDIYPFIVSDNWTFGQSTGVSSNNSAYTSQNPNAPEGGQVAFVQGNVGEICQTIQAYTGIYALEFMAAQRIHNNNGTPFSMQEIAIIINGVTVKTIIPTSTTYTLYGALVDLNEAEASCYEICFKGLTTVGTDNTVFIDAVNLLSPQDCTDNDGDGICDVEDDCTESFTILDASFEIALNSDYNIYPDPILNLSNWTFGQNTGVSSNNSAYTNQNSDAPEGSQNAFIQGDLGEICQTIQTLNNGLYTLEFMAAQRLYNGNFPTTPFSMQEIAIMIDGEIVETIIPTDTTYALYEAAIDLEAGCHEICFRGLTAVGEDNTVFIDAVNLIFPQDCTDACSFNLAAKILLEGPYIDDGTMNTGLSGLLPLTQPYNVAPYNYMGTETAFTIPANVVDWILVEMRSGIPSFSTQNTMVEESKAGFLLSNGDIVEVDGVSPLTFENLVDGENYYICIRHRNHLDILSGFPITANTTMNYDFTISAEQALGVEQIKEVESGVFVLYSGDYTQDGIIQATDYDAWSVLPASLNVYSVTDGNLDGVVQSTDYDKWSLNKAKLGSPEIQF